MSTTNNKDNGASKPGRYSYVELLSEWQLKNRNFGWMEFAACKGADQELFFAEGAEYRASTNKAQQYCKNCVVYKDCLKFAIDNNITYGIWGGLNPKQRRKNAQVDDGE